MGLNTFVLKLKMSIRNKRVQHEINRYPLLSAAEKPWGEVLSLSVRHLRVDLTHQYPFRPPTFFFNNEDVLVSLKKKYMAVFPLLRPYNFDVPCVCCRIFISNTCWVPSMRIEDALEDYLMWETLLNALFNYCVIKHRFPFDDLVHAHILRYLIPKKS